jgi:hypothetical protein
MDDPKRPHETEDDECRQQPSKMPRLELRGDDSSLDEPWADFPFPDELKVRLLVRRTPSLRWLTLHVSFSRCV